ncbi:effector-associated constant component EACC1 [Streptomyces violens]|uniref:effector-associated constant component EACC1 n=1 Tax=Streptomyces violens TaxID=66377 RepID=UPI0004BF7DD5|nr:hypothetical protein [Streptomyces violens]
MKVELELRNAHARTGAVDAEDETTQHELRLLRNWLHDARREHHSTIEPGRQRTHSGEMGTGLELVLALVSTGASLIQLLISVDTWREARRPRSQIVIRVNGATAADLEAARQAVPDLTVLAGETEASDECTDGEPEGAA